MIFWLCMLFSLADPSSSIIQLRNMQDSSEVSNSKKNHIEPRIINPLARHSIADSLMQKPSFLAMLNRYGMGKDVVHDIAQKKKELFVFRKKYSRWYLLKENNNILFTMLALSKEEIYPEKDPFSKSRNQTLFDSIRHLKKGCKSFSAEADGFVRRWTGQGCTYGNVWIEWEPTRAYPMYVLIESL